MFITEDNKQLTLGKAFITEEGKHVALGKAFITEDGVFRALNLGGRGISEFMTYHNTNGFVWQCTDDGTSVKKLSSEITSHTMVWVRNNIMYRMKKVVDSNGYSNCILQKKDFESATWTDIRASGNSTTAYYMSYNQYDDVFIITKVFNNANGESQSREGAVSLYYAKFSGTTIESDSTIFTTNYLWTNSSFSVEFASMDFWEVPPTIYCNGNKMFLYMRYYVYSGGRIIYINGFNNGTDGWYALGAQSIGVTDPVLFNGFYFGVASPFGFEPPIKMTFYTGTSSPGYQVYNDASTPPGPSSNISGNGRARFFLYGGKLVYVVLTKPVDSSTTGTVRIYTSTDGVTFTLVKTHTLQALNERLYNVLYLGETEDTWNFLVSTRRSGTTQQANGSFYYINKADLSLESESPITIDGEPMYFGVTKYE